MNKKKFYSKDVSLILQKITSYIKKFMNKSKELLGFNVTLIFSGLDEHFKN